MQVQRHFNLIKCTQFQFFTTPAVFLSGMMPTKVKYGMLLNEVRGSVGGKGGLSLVKVCVGCKKV